MWLTVTGSVVEWCILSSPQSKIKEHLKVRIWWLPDFLEHRPSDFKDYLPFSIYKASYYNPSLRIYVLPGFPYKAYLRTSLKIIIITITYSGVIQNKVSFQLASKLIF